MGPVSKSEKPSAPSRRPIVAVIGASSAAPLILEAAYQVGAAICAEGWHLLTGGGGGVMEAACRGFVEAGTLGRGAAIGLLPSDDARLANEFVEIAIPTGIGFARNAIIARTAWAVIAVGGCSGTLSEIALAWQSGRPIAALAHTGGWAAHLAGKPIDERRDDVVFAARSPVEAIDFVRERISSP